jgi:pimeloyl-ACP methyl ester carboxylesterase
MRRRRHRDCAVNARPVVFVHDGVALNVADSGDGGLPVMMQHGLCGDAQQISEVFPDDPRFRRLTMECRGHGASEVGDPTKFSIATFASDLSALIESRRLAPLVIGGVSMGAAIALRLAVRRAELVHGLVLARPAWVVSARPDNMKPNGEVGQLLGAYSSDQARRLFLASETARRLSDEAPDNLASLDGFFSRTPRAVTAALLQAIASDGPGICEAEARRIAVPTLVIGTKQDSIHPFAHAETLALLIPNSRLVEITPKSQDRAQYVRDFRTALTGFLGDFA